MGAISKISWTDGTINWWEGCRKRSAGCLHCYAEARDNRLHHGDHWGKGAPRKKSKSALENLRKFQKYASEGRFTRCAHCGARSWAGDDPCCQNQLGRPVRPTFFVMSLGDFGDEEVPDEWRAEALVEMIAAKSCDFMILTKEPGQLRELWGKASLCMTAMQREAINNWLEGIDVPLNIAIGTTVEDDKVAEKRLYELANFPAARRFISAEPLIRGGWFKLLNGYPPGTFNLVISGGESLAGARPCHPDWITDLETTCDRLGIPFHHKQWGEWAPALIVTPDWTKPTTGNMLYLAPDGTVRAFDPKQPARNGEAHVWRAGKKNSGWSVDRTHRTRTERLAFPLQPWKEGQWYAIQGVPGDILPTRYFPGLVPAQEYAARWPEQADLIQPSPPPPNIPYGKVSGMKGA